MSELLWRTRPVARKVRYLRSKILTEYKFERMWLNHSCSRKYLFYLNCMESNKPEQKLIEGIQKLILLNYFLQYHETGKML